jgi:hypothetical protein
MSKRNLIRQQIIKKDGSEKNIFHSKEFPSVDWKTWWNDKNKAPKTNSKRQQKLRDAILDKIHVGEGQS